MPPTTSRTGSCSRRRRARRFCPLKTRRTAWPFASTPCSLWTTVFTPCKQQSCISAGRFCAVYFNATVFRACRVWMARRSPNDCSRPNRPATPTSISLRSISKPASRTCSSLSTGPQNSPSSNCMNLPPGALRRTF